MKNKKRAIDCFERKGYWFVQQFSRQSVKYTIKINHIALLNFKTKN